ncbi:hypothetical protein D6D12_10749 [Aureobasidium pullulans]|uniref:Uncharacterized protein n=1 Tax=Aureobasidium pullulans TaxID=5580 RepID=A0AB74JEX4_AURPU|nr:hypothetical protein D6D12_10749 [Aureobasidium pullulans]THX30259.1 hypothetical protein D6D11_10009 [Aureobasidium pullulans]THX76567.1 hypothetical protein D6D08_05278 [Aureobasidium pullulans]
MTPKWWRNHSLPGSLASRARKYIISPTPTPSLKTFQSIPHPILTMLAKFIVSVLSLCGRAQKEEAELLPMVRCDFGCDVHVHGRSHNRREFKRPRRAIGWEGRMGIPPQDLVSTHVKVSKLRFSNEHQVQKYDVHGPPCVVRRAEQVGGLRAGAFVWPDGSLSLGRVHPKARNRTNASDVWSTHGHMVSYT